MKIAYIGIKGVPSKGGAERVVEAIARRLNSKYELTIYCNSRYTPKDMTLPDVKLIRIWCLPGKHLQSLSLFIFSALHAFFLRNYTIIHVHNAEAGFVIPFLRLRFQVVGTSHGAAYERDKWNNIAKYIIRKLDYFFISYSDKVTSVSLPVAKAYEQEWGRNIEYLPNGVDDKLIVDEFKGKSKLKQHGVKNDYILFSAGRMDRTKGCHFLIEAFTKLNTQIDLVVIGDSKTDPQYIKELKKKADARIHFIPFIEERSELFGILKQAKIFIFPSTVEAMSMALLEAASLRVPIICSDIPANTAVLPEYAVFFKSGDVEDLGEKLDWALNNMNEMNKIAEEIEKILKEEYSWDYISEKYGYLYNSMVKAA